MQEFESGRVPLAMQYQKGGSILRMLWDYMSSAHYASARLPAPGSHGHDANVGSHCAL